MPLVARYTIGANISIIKSKVEIVADICMEPVKSVKDFVRLNVAMLKRIATVIESIKGLYTLYAPTIAKINSAVIIKEVLLIK